MAIKKRMKPTKTIPEGRGKQIPFIQKAGQIYNSVEPWIPWIIGGLYSIVMAYITFRYHTVGGLDVETDFYAELYPQARKLVEGQFSPLNYGAKGPVYSILLAASYGIVRDYFIAGQVLNLFSSGVFIAALYYLIKQVFNSLTALLTVLFVISNYMFQNFTYQVSSDMPFMAFCVLSMLFLIRKGGTRGLILSSLFGILAFLTRYNGVFIALGSVLYLSFEQIPFRERLKKIGIWAGIFFIAGLPWFIPNTIATGNPVHNDNYINVMLEFYGRGPDGLEYENWTEALPKQFTGMGDIFLYDPVYFVKKVIFNVFDHYIWDMRGLIHIYPARGNNFLQWSFPFFITVGLFVFWFCRPSRRMVIYFSFGIIYFLILTLVFYNARFSLYLLAFYAPLAIWPFTNEKISGRFGKFSWIPAAVIMFSILSYTIATTRAVLDDVRYTPYFLKDMGRALGDYEPVKSRKLLARKPHAAYYADLVPSMFPGDTATVEELVEYCRNNDIDYILYSLVEAKYRPQLQDLLNLQKNHPGLDLIHVNKVFGVIYRVKSD